MSHKKLTPKQALQKYWGHNDFRFNQAEIIDAVLAGKDCVALLQTGGGKSICYQIPALLKPGLCLVVSPLISLMNDQVKGLNNRGLKAVALTAGMSKSQLERELENCQNQHYKFLFVSPERLRSEWLRERLRHIKINLLTVDEAHCISQWGHDFRPPYLKIAEIKSYIEDVPVLALTATANAQVLKDIREYLELETPQIFRTTFLRKNIEITVRPAEDKLNPILTVLEGIRESAIIYVRSRKKTLEFSKILNYKGFTADFFHGGLDGPTRAKKQQKWMDGNTQIMVATTAFGMGIDKANVRYVLHPDLPEDLESYYQEIGRAGRDGVKSHAFLFYNHNDLERLYYRWIEQYPSLAEIKEIYQKLGNHLQVAVNHGAFVEHAFIVTEFCRKYNFEINKTVHALQYLQKLGLVEYAHAQNRPSQIQVLLNHTQETALYNQIKSYQLIKVLVRSYGGITELPIKVDLRLMATRLNRSLKDIRENLENLHQRKLIAYAPPIEGELIIYLKDRIEEKYLDLDRVAHQQIIKVRKQKFYSLEQFIEEDEVCRNKIILGYFGETLEKDCGSCDICRRKSYLNIKSELQKHLTQPKKINDLLRLFPNRQNELLQQIRILIDLGEMEKTGDLIYFKR